jgi:sialidase-1
MASDRRPFRLCGSSAAVTSSTAAAGNGSRGCAKTQMTVALLGTMASKGNVVMSFGSWFVRLNAFALILLGLQARPLDAAEKIEATIGRDGVSRTLLLPPSKDNPRNSEGDFVQLNDGRIMFVYTHFTGGGGDHDSAFLAARFSDDGGASWNDQDTIVLKNEGAMNVMSVSLLRLKGGKIALFYARKNSLSDTRPFMRTSSDEGQTWSEPQAIIPDSARGYYVLNNDRVVQLQKGQRKGRLIVPVALHNGAGRIEKWTGHGQVMCYFSDDDGRIWRRSESILVGRSPQGKPVQLQEPGVVELRDGGLLMFIRTDAGTQYFSRSTDAGNSWSEPEPGPLRSPLSPASIERIPETGDLLAVWNDNYDPKSKTSGDRTPLNVAVSKDEGKTWIHRKTIESDPRGWYCYTAIEFVGNRVLLGHCSGGAGRGRLNTTQITSFDVEFLYAP